MHFLNLSQFFNFFQFFNEMKNNEEESFLSSVKCRIRTVYFGLVFTIFTLALSNPILSNPIHCKLTCCTYLCMFPRVFSARAAQAVSKEYTFIWLVCLSQQTDIKRSIVVYQVQFQELQDTSVISSVKTRQK